MPHIAFHVMSFFRKKTIFDISPLSDSVVCHPTFQTTEMSFMYIKTFFCEMSLFRCFHKYSSLAAIGWKGVRVYAYISNGSQPVWIRGASASFFPRKLCPQQGVYSQVCMRYLLCSNLTVGQAECFLKINIMNACLLLGYV